MFPAFSYTAQMQLVLAVLVFILTFFTLYLVAELILAFCAISATRGQKCVFALISGTLMHNVWIYAVYFIGGRASFSSVQYSLLCSPNPLFALVYYYVALKVLKFSPVRSIKTMGYAYMYWICNKTINRLLKALFFVQGEPYNFLLDAMQQTTMFVIFLVGTLVLKRLVVTHHIQMKFIDSGFFHRFRELGKYFLQACFLYVSIVVTEIFIPNAIAANVILNLIVILFLLLNVWIDLHGYYRHLAGNQIIHISALFKGMEEFRGIKHDFYNILHTYSGYLELEEYDKLRAYHASLVKATTSAGVSMDLAGRMGENPALVSLLMDKMETADRQQVKLMIALECDISDFYIHPLDLMRILSCLLDNAIEAAGEARDRRVHVTCEEKDACSKLIIITNTTVGPVAVDDIHNNGVTTKPGHSGIGLYTVRSTLEKYGNCTYQLKYFNHEFSAYIAVRQRAE